MSEAPKTPAMTALMDYQQADMEGIFVNVSRQAIHEVADEYEALQARIAELEAEVKRLSGELQECDALVLQLETEREVVS